MCIPSGGGLEKSVDLDLSSVPLLWMENEAESAGLRLRPRRETGGGWNLDELKQSRLYESVKGLWWPLAEYLPLKRLSFKTPNEVTR